MIGDKRGITLMELLVVMGIFSIVVTLSSSIFLQSNRAQRRVLTATAAQADLRFVLEAIVREVRSGSIDYARYASSGGVSVPTERLILKNANGQREEFFLDRTVGVCPTGVTQCVAMSLDGSAAQSLTSLGVNVDRLTFYVTPQLDPFTPDPATGLFSSNKQPTVTIAIRVTTVGGQARQDPVTYTAQTTVASRNYVR
jgi:prepilin-type N-terminal cleavage/methylation domain-containing protein